ncbi:MULTISPECIES: hypothetical protein [Pseudomonas]|uniref:DUF4189 domain-containing protein n=1 Tax=Pseudomonas frederiksbergensis TaxID=104087 RepID=A0A2S8HGI6_9PSED|nr:MULTISPECIES: hypothetical protein [Pseudomonas]PQP01616.1 hypothetical protein C5612_19895 [Pseudomonas frederiksbergensis]WLG48235.1 hypothetical protein PSH64_15860 [Pseudomonas sp. FP1742]
MTGKTAHQCSSWVLPSLLAINLALTAGCAGKAATARYTASSAGSSTGSNCYAKALPTAGEGGLAWGSTLNLARQKSLDNCIRYAGQSGGTPDTCHVVAADCKN